MIYLVFTFWIILPTLITVLICIGGICIFELLHRLFISKLITKYKTYKHWKSYQKAYEQLKMQNDIIERANTRINELEKALGEEQEKYPLFFWRELTKEKE